MKAMRDGFFGLAAALHGVFERNEVLTEGPVGIGGRPGGPISIVLLPRELQDGVISTPWRLEMHKLLALLAVLVAAAVEAAPRASIDATIRGTDQPLEVELLARAGESEWRTVAHRHLDATNRRVRFDELVPDIYQLRIQGTQPTEQLATKVVLGANDQRRVVITVEPVELTGRITYGGTEIAGVLLLRHAEFLWRGGVAVAADGTFRAPFWQRGEYRYEIRGPALSTPFQDVVQVNDAGPVAIDIPDGRIRGVVRQANGGAPVARASVIVESTTTMQMNTNAEGRFDFTGVKDGRYKVIVASRMHLEPEPIAVQIDSANRQRELIIDLDRGRTLPLVVVDPRQAPVIDAMVYVVAGIVPGNRICSRTLTDRDGRTNVAVPADEEATLFVVPRAGSFAVQRVAKNDGGPLRVGLPPASSSLLIRTRTSTGAEMPPFSLLMRFDGAVVPPEIAEALATAQGLHLEKGEGADVRLEKIPSGSYEFWPYRTSEEAEAILATADSIAAPIQIDVQTGDNSVAVQFAAR